MDFLISCNPFPPLKCRFSLAMYFISACFPKRSYCSPTPFQALEFVSLSRKRTLKAVIDRLFASERAKVIIVIAVVAVGTGLTAKNVISFPAECSGEQQVQFWASERVAKA